MKDSDNKCSFCGRGKKEVNLLISGQNAQICDTCVAQANDIINEESRTHAAPVFDFSKIKLLKPFEIKKFPQQISKMAKVMSRSVRCVKPLDWTSAPNASA